VLQSVRPYVEINLAVQQRQIYPGWLRGFQHTESQQSTRKIPPSAMQSRVIGQKPSNFSEIPTASACSIEVWDTNAPEKLVNFYQNGRGHVPK